MYVRACVCVCVCACACACVCLCVWFAGEITFPDFMEVMTETMSCTTQWGQLKTPLNGHVGFDSLQSQITQKALKRGFEFNLMVVGEFLCSAQGEVRLLAFVGV